MFKNYGVHLHIPAGAIPKDGPSAGVTMTSALASLYTGRRVRPDTAMTGEITLSGLVFPVGGIKEKVLAAHRAGIKRIIIPARNEADLEDIPEEVRGEMEFVLVSRIGDVLNEALEKLVANPPPPAAPTDGARERTSDQPDLEPMRVKER
jgi:ATP-dependent Lon protease